LKKFLLKEQQEELDHLEFYP